MDLKDLQRNWHAYGKRDPLFAILSFKDKRDNKWDPSEFFATGEAEIADVMEHLAKLGLSVHPGRALDFGCGAGRLAQALGMRFESVDGVDIAPSMVQLARQHNRHGQRCQYHLNERDDLRLFEDGSFDFIYSCIVLQHMEPRYAKAYLAEFVRLLKPGGLLVFQQAGELRRKRPQAAHASSAQRGGLKRLIPSPLMKLYRRVRTHYRPVMEVYGIPRQEVLDLVQSLGAQVLADEEDRRAGGAFTSYRYVVRK